MPQGHAVPSHTSPMAMKEQAPHRLMSESILPKATAPRLTLTSATLNGIPYGDKNLSQVFTSHLKTRGWSQQRLHKLHIVMFVLTFFMYVCHIISLPPFEILGKKMVIIFEIVQLFLLVIGIACWLTMCYVNASWAVTRRIFQKSLRTYIYLFWLIRSLVTEVLKGRTVYACIHVFHSIILYSTDTWFICDQKVLIIDLGMFLCIMVYEFFISLSPYALEKPSWKFVNVPVTANSLARSNFFNLFLIFLDAALVAIFDMRRSKYIMLVTKKKRGRSAELSIFKQQLVFKFLIAMVFTAIAATALHIVSTVLDVNLESKNLYDSILLFILFVLWVLIMYLALDPEYRTTLCHLSRERRVIFIVVLLGVLNCVDVWEIGFRVAQLTFNLAVFVILTLDILQYQVSRKVSIAIVPILAVVLLWNINVEAFQRSDCENNRLPWGIMGRSVSSCTIRRMIYQSILTLLISAFVTVLRNRKGSFLFYNANIYRTTGRGTRNSVDHSFVGRISEQIGKESVFRVQKKEVEAKQVRIREVSV